MTEISFVESEERRLICVNGILDKDSYVHIYTDDENKKSAHVENEEVFDFLISETFNELSKTLVGLTCTKGYLWWNDGIEININCVKRIYQSGYKEEVGLKFTYSMDFERWNKPYSILDLYHALKESLVDKNKNLKFSFYDPDEDNPANGFGIVMVANPESKIVENFNLGLKFLEELTLSTIESLKEKMDENIVTAYFNFPDSIKSSSKQYLIYFGQFLADLGIDADTEIREQAHKTLFTVHPKDKNQSLSRIKEALEVFLNAPSMNVIVEDSDLNNIAVVQLKSSIINLQSNMMMVKSALQLKEAVLQAKDATIQTQEVSIQSLNLTNYQLTSKLLDFENKDNEREKLLDGLFELKKFETPVGDVNLPEIYRQLKRIFK
jgi:hypothetical protein